MLLYFVINFKQALKYLFLYSNPNHPSFSSYNGWAVYEYNGQETLKRRVNDKIKR